MRRCLKIYVTGFIISFLGTLPLGTLNITAFQIAVFQSAPDALFFALAAVFVELVMVRIALTKATNFDFKSKLFFYVLLIAFAFLMYLAISSLASSGNQSELSEGVSLLPMIKSTFLLGLTLSVLNPMHIPFWMGWNNILMNRKTLDRKPGMYSSYIAGIGVGSIGGLSLFIFAGKHIFQNYRQYGYLIAFLTGCVYLGFSFYLLYLLYRNHLKLNY